MRKIIKISFITLLVALVASSGVVYYFYTNIKPILVTEINKALAVEVNVKEINISGLKDFPKLGIKLKDVSINESTSFYNEKLLEAKELNLFIDIMRLWKGDYVIDGVALRDGKLNLADLAKKSNYDIIKPSNDTSNVAVSFEIKSLKLINCALRYSHTPSDFSCNASTPNSNIRLKYLEETTNLKIKTKLNGTTLTVEGEKYISNKDLAIQTGIAVNTASSTVNISTSDIDIEEVKLQTEGTVFFGNNSNLDIEFKSNSTTAQSLLSILPNSLSQSFNHVKLSGNALITGTFKGEMNDNQNPSLHLEYRIDNSNLAIPSQKIKLAKISANGLLTMPNISNIEDASVTCKLRQANSDGNSIRGDISVKNFIKPTVNWKGNAELEAAFLSALADSSSFDANQGSIAIEGELNFIYDTEKGELVPNSLHYIGNVQGKNIVGIIKNPKLDVKNVSFNLSADTEKLVVNEANFSYNNTTGSVVGYINEYNSLFDKNSDAVLVGDLNINNLNVNELYSTSTESNSLASSSSNISPIQFKLNAELTNFKYNDFKAESMTGYLLSDRKRIEMPKCKIDALQGKTAAAISVKKLRENYLLDINSELQKISINQLLKQFNNFEQEEITHEHLNGRLTGNILAKVILDQNYEPILSKLYAKANVTITDGQLKNYEPLKELSSFVEINDLEDVKFKTITNTIEIFDQTIFIPKMRIENNALNMDLEGTHTFENYMNYRISLSVAELLATKANWIAKKKERRIEQNQNGGLTAYILMEGTPEDLSIKYDRTAVKENIKEEVKKEKAKFLKALKGEGTLEEETSETKDYDNVWDE
ncbi:MAG: hypothetical protein HKP14_11930 [Bacteroidia bacterium]|nr:hypothetical protein [Bacteroidia bacterium]